jgi:hypothetical protein
MNISAERDMHIHDGNFYSVGRDMITQILPNSFGATIIYFIDESSIILNSFALDLTIALNPVLDAGHNRKGRIAGCMDGTRKEIIALIMQWIDGGNDCPVCWLNGPAGYGKSAIAQTLASRCAARNQLGASFFFLRGTGDRSKFIRFISTLAHQLASQALPSMKPHIQSVLEKESLPFLLQQTIEYQFKRLVIDPVIAAAGLTHPIVIIIDALDECDDKTSVGEFLDAISSAIQHNLLPFRLFITSRVEEHIQQAFNLSFDNPGIYPLALQDFTADADIHSFFRSCFSAIYKEKYRFMKGVPQPWPSAAVLDRLVQNSSGSFVFASTLVDFVRQGSSPAVTLQAAVESHTGLDPLYHQIFSAAPPHEHFARTIGTIMLLVQPLSISDLGTLLGLETSSILDLLLGIQAILRIPQDDNQPITLVHTSLRDFLTTPLRSSSLYINPICHANIAADCLEAIKQPPPPQDGIFYTGGKEYASLNWCYHFLQGLIRSGGDDVFLLLPQTTLMTNLQKLAQDYWINTMILTGAAEKATNNLTLILDVLDVSIYILQ